MGLYVCVIRVCSCRKRWGKDQETCLWGVDGVSEGVSGSLN